MKNKTKYSIPKNMPVITDEMMYPLINLKKISITRTVRTIYKGAFYNKTKLKDVYFEKSSKLTKIPESCFNGCTNLTNINLPYGLVTIEKYAFKNCTNLKILYLPKSITEVHPDAFYGWRDDQVIYSPIKLRKPLTSNAKVIIIEDEIYGDNREFDKYTPIKYFLITVKCGHVGRHRYMPITFPIKASTKKEAVSIVRNYPRVKRHHSDFILNIEQVDEKSFFKQIEINNSDPYLKLRRKADQNKIITLIEHRLVPEPNYKRRN